MLTGDPASPEESIALHAQDIRRLQLAKGSIRCGANVLLREAGLQPSDVDRVLLAGAFGSYIDPAQALAIGLLPPVPVDAVEAIGNAAGHGARMCLLSLTSRVRATDLPGHVHYVELSAVPDFQGSVRRRHGLSGAGRGGGLARVLAHVGTHQRAALSL